MYRYLIGMTGWLHFVHQLGYTITLISLPRDELPTFFKRDTSSFLEKCAPLACFCCWYTHRNTACCSSWPLPDSAPGGFWLSWPHLCSLSQCLCISPGLPSSLPPLVLFLFPFKFCQEPFVHPCRLPATLVWLPALQHGPFLSLGEVVPENQPAADVSSICWLLYKHWAFAV